jgi:hypothetical protein
MIVVGLFDGNIAVYNLQKNTGTGFCNKFLTNVKNTGTGFYNKFAKILIQVFATNLQQMLIQEPVFATNLQQMLIQEPFFAINLKQMLIQETGFCNKFTTSVLIQDPVFATNLQKMFKKYRNRFCSKFATNVNSFSLDILSQAVHRRKSINLYCGPTGSALFIEYFQFSPI